MCGGFFPPEAAGGESQPAAGSVALCSSVTMMDSVQPNKESARSNFMFLFKLRKFNVKSTCGKEGFKFLFILISDRGKKNAGKEFGEHWLLFQRLGLLRIFSFSCCFGLF